MRQIVSLRSSLDWLAINLPNGSNVSPLALASKIFIGAAKQENIVNFPTARFLIYLPCSLTSQMQIVESVLQLAK